MSAVGLVASAGRKERRLKFLELLFDSLTAEVMSVPSLSLALPALSLSLTLCLSLGI
jgi:hypothetical protein